MKDKIIKWQVVNSTGDWVDSLIEICDAINNQTQEYLLVGVAQMQSTFLQKSKSSTSCTIFTTEEERQVLRQIFVEDIDSFCEEAEYRKDKRQKPESHSQRDGALEISLNNEGYEKKNSDPENTLQFKYIRCPCYLLFMLIH